MKVSENHTPPSKDIEDSEVVITDPLQSNQQNQLLFKSIETPDISANPTPIPTEDHQ